MQKINSEIFPYWRLDRVVGGDIREGDSWVGWSSVILFLVARVQVRERKE
jgi:hypothetical protein